MSDELTWIEVPGNPGPMAHGTEKSMFARAWPDCLRFSCRLAAAVLAAACTEPAVIPQPPPLDGPFFFAATVNGQTWLPSADSSALTVDTALGILNIQATLRLTDSTAQQITVATPVPQPLVAGSYDVPDGFLGGMSFQRWHHSSVVELSFVQIGRPGRLLVSEVSVAAGRFAGAFEGTLYDITGRAAYHLSGTFRLPLAAPTGVTP